MARSRGSAASAVALALLVTGACGDGEDRPGQVTRDADSAAATASTGDAPAFETVRVDDRLEAQPRRRTGPAVASKW